MLGWAFTASPAQVSIRLVFEFAFKAQAPYPCRTPGCPASTHSSLPPCSKGFNLLSKSLLAKAGICHHLSVHLRSRKGLEGVEGSPTLG